jgi:hypothetical protein
LSQNETQTRTAKKSKNVPTNMKLYKRVKSEAKKKFDVYPSAYANAWLVKTYKSRGGKYKRVVESDLKDWFEKEKWVDVSRPKKEGGYEECGRSDASKGKYPVCTPEKKAESLTEKERKNRIRAKRKNEKNKRDGKSPHMTQYTDAQGGKSNPSKKSN